VLASMCVRRKKRVKQCACAYILDRERGRREPKREGIKKKEGKRSGGVRGRDGGRGDGDGGWL
jgi:hypothetical protein